MLNILVFVHRDATLARHGQITQELQAIGLKVTASYASVGVIAGMIEDRTVLTPIQQIKDVTGVHEVGAPASGD